ncbi:hypothetical protein LAD12857_25560 [Lacrimispora amygdalina]|uniref:Uncharacterized protein n=2 Tax=Lacrimispora amygdalina TaxID=253257 RepID=A0ABQ5M6Q7_9FIRM|nr:hypothetical protein [uncultured Clostridium sp.]
MSNNIYAIIFENVVKNIIVADDYSLADTLAKASYGNDAFAVDSSRYATAIGDLYEGGIFYHILEDGTKMPVEYIPTEKELIENLNQKIVEIQNLLTDIYELKLSMNYILVLLKNTLTEISDKLSGTPDMKSIANVYADLIERSIKTGEIYKSIEEVPDLIRDSVRNILINRNINV